MMRKLRTLRRGDAGATTIGLIIAIIVVAAVATAAVSVVVNFERTAMRNALESQASDAAASVFEVANATPWADLALSTSDPNLSDLGIQALAAGQPLVTLDPGAFNAFEPLAAVVTGELENFGTINEGFTVYSAVTWENEPTVSIATGDYTSMFGTKRVSVMVKWGDGERESQTFTTLVAPTIAEAVPTNVNIKADGGLQVERDIDAPSLAGNDATGALTATIAKAYRWEIQMSTSTSFSSSEVLCSGEYAEVTDTTEDCTYKWKASIGLRPSFRVKVWTLDTNNADAAASGIKYSNKVTFPGPRLAALTGGKVAWNKDQIFWPATVGLMGAEYDSSAPVDTVVQRRVSGTYTTLYQSYNIAGDTKTFTTARGESTIYRVCTRVNGTWEVCSGWFGPLYTVTSPSAPALSGWRSGHLANYTWSSDADSYVGSGGVGLRYDIQQLQGDNSTWSNVRLGTTQTSLYGVSAPSWGGYLRTTARIRVRVQNNAGFSPWTYKTVTLWTQPTTPSLSGWRSGFTGRYSWSAGGDSPVYDVQQLQGNNSTWWNVYLDSTRTSWYGVQPKPWGGYLRTTTRIRVRAENASGVSAWAYKTVRVGELPTTPSIWFSNVWTRGWSSPRLGVRAYWNAASYAYSGWDYRYSDTQGRSSSSHVNAWEWRSRAQYADDYAVGTFKVRGTNQFGVSSWRTNSIAYNAPPTIAGNITNVVPQQGKFWVSWASVPGASGYQIQYYVNGDRMVNSPTCENPYLSYCTSALSVTFDAYVHEGDRFQIRVRGYNASGAGPWSSFTGSKYARMRSVGRPSVSTYPRTSGGLYNWPNLACDTGSRAEYDVYETYWQAWMTRSYYYESFGYGEEGAAAIRQRCRNTTTGYASYGTYVWKTVPYRLLYNNAWNGNMWRRLQQATSFSNPPGTNYGRPNQWTKYAYYSFDSKVLQNWMNAHDYGRYSNIAVDGYWGPSTTLKMQQNIAIRCGYWVAGDSVLGGATLSGLEYCLNNNRW